MKIAQSSSRAVVSLLFVLGAAACDGSPESAAEVESLRGRATDTTGQAEFEVDVRYAGGVTRAQAAALIEHLEIFPARDVMPTAQIPFLKTAAADEPLDTSAPTYAITLRPLNDVAARERYAWAASADARPEVPAATSGSDGIVERQSALNADIEVAPETLGYNELWVSNSRFRCHSFTVQLEVIPGSLIKPCIIQGASGNAGTSCGVPGVGAYTSIGDWNPTNQHYFRGGAKGYPGGVLLGIYVVCI